MTEAEIAAIEEAKKSPLPSGKFVDVVLAEIIDGKIRRSFKRFSFDEFKFHMNPAMLLWSSVKTLDEELEDHKKSIA